jgi:hypothetical protein
VQFKPSRIDPMNREPDAFPDYDSDTGPPLTGGIPTKAHGLLTTTPATPAQAHDRQPPGWSAVLRQPAVAVAAARRSAYSASRRAATAVTWLAAVSSVAGSSAARWHAVR